MTTSPNPRFVLLFAPLLMLAACERRATPTGGDAANATPAAAHSPADTAQARNAPAFDVEVSLSPQAQARLAQPRETIIVAAEYFGEPSADAQARKVAGSENPWLQLHRREIELDGAGVAHFPAVALDARQLAWTDRPDAPQVNINVYSGRRSAPDNLLGCDMFQDTLAVAARATVRLQCRLIAEDATR